MTPRRLPRIMAVAVLIMAAAVSCCPPNTEYVVQHCPSITMPPRPYLPIEDYRDTWTKDQMLSAYTQSTVLLLGWGRVCEEAIKAHNLHVENPPKGL